MKRMKIIIGSLCILCVLAVTFEASSQKKISINKNAPATATRHVAPATPRTVTRPATPRTAANRQRRVARQQVSYGGRIAPVRGQSQQRHHNAGPTRARQQNFFNIEGEKYAVNFSANGGSEEFIINSSSSWSIGTTTAAWGSLTRNGNTLTLTVQPNQSKDSRTDYFVIENNDKQIKVEISQKGDNRKVQLNASSLMFDATGGTKSVGVDANTEWSVSSSSTSDWLTYSKSGNTIDVTAQPNTTYDTRTASLSVNGGNDTYQVSISQKGKSHRLILSRDEINVSAAGGTEYISIAADGELWSVSLNPDPWVKLTKEGDRIVLNIAPNDFTNNRTDFFVVASKDETQRVSISQEGAPQNKKSISNDNNNSHQGIEKKHGFISWIKGRVSIGIEAFGNISTKGYKSRTEYTTNGGFNYGAGVVIRFGKFSDIVNLSVGSKWMRSESENNYITLPINLKLNLIGITEGAKIYTGGGFELGLKSFNYNKSRFGDWNVGVGINSRHWDWFIYYKRFIGLWREWIYDNESNKHIGTSLTYYF